MPISLEREQEEQDNFAVLSAAEQKAIRLVLHCAHPGTETELIKGWPVEAPYSAFRLAILTKTYDTLRRLPDLASRVANPENWTDRGLNATVFFGEALSIAAFCVAWHGIKTFQGFDFLFVRLFGGAVRPLIPSLFAAALLHPTVWIGELMQADEDFMEAQLRCAMSARVEDRSKHEPVWFPLSRAAEVRAIALSE